MACKFCGAGGETSPNHATSAACVTALHAEIAQLRSLPTDPRAFVITDPPKRGEQETANAVAPRLSLER
jgi:hypothetical protein